MSAVKIRFLEARTVQDEHVGTDLETTYEAGSTYGFEPRSAARWVKRGVAVFATPEDAAAAREAVGDFVEADPNEAPSAATVGQIEETDLARSFGVKLVAAHMNLTPEEFAALPATERVDGLTKAHALFDKESAERATRREPPEAGGKGPEGPAGQNAGAGAGADTPGADPDFENLTDDELRAFVEDRDGKKPHPNAGRETLLAKAKAGPATEA